MRYSYSNVSTATSCAYRWWLTYRERLKTIPDQNADNALNLGLALHKGIEDWSVESALTEYKSHYNLLSDAHISWMIQVETQVAKVLEVLPKSGEHEIEVKTDDFVGYIDYVVGDTIYDFKFSNNIERYLESPQLSIYKYYLEQVRPDIKINHLKFVFVPKSAIRQKKTETVMAFRQRLVDTLAKTEVKIVEVPYDEQCVLDFQKICSALDNVTIVEQCPKNPTKLCDWCQYQKYCESDGTVDWMIYSKERNDDEMVLPTNERRTAEKPSKRTMMIYGAPFSGKTTFADGAPDPLMLNTDGNAIYATAPYISIQDEIKVTGRMTSRRMAWDVFKDVITELEKGQNTFKTIVIDLANDTYEMCRVYMYDKLGITHESDDSFRAWDKVRTEYLSTMRRVMHLPYENIILLCHEDATKDLTKKSGEKFSSVRPKMQDKIADSLAGMVAFVGRAYVDDGKHLLSIKSDETTFGGGRLGISNVVVPLEWAEVEKLFTR